MFRLMHVNKEPVVCAFQEHQQQGGAVVGDAFVEHFTSD